MNEKLLAALREYLHNHTEQGRGQLAFVPVDGINEILSRYTTTENKGGVTVKDVCEAHGVAYRANCIHRENISLELQPSSCQRRFGIDSCPCPDDADEHCTTARPASPTKADKVLDIDHEIIIVNNLGNNRWCVHIGEEHIFEAKTEDEVVRLAKEWRDNCVHQNSVLAKADKVEPLDIIAAKKGLRIQRFPLVPFGQEAESGIWTVCVNSQRGTEYKAQRLPLDEAETLARAFLTGLDDVTGKGGK